ncbi:MAG: hypothetical protein [Olavius algarvensis Gamma 3 endosymbiont]|nr:MAG: hypothetical protein [Olavius algarvensis Gamma 3 endosymbiont]
MNLKPQDVLFLLKLVVKDEEPWTFNELAIELGMSPSEVHGAANRVVAARLAIKDKKRVRPHIRNLLEYLIHGIQYSFIPDRGGMNRGVPTAYAAAPLIDKFVSDSEPPPVWPDPNGKARGESFSPLYKSAPVAAEKDSKLYELLALVDAIRGGKVREREMAKKEIEKRFGKYGQSSKS